MRSLTPLSAARWVTKTTNNMDAILMCAGLGTRMRPLTNDTPKPLIPIAGKSSLFRTLEILPSEITRIIIVASYLEEKIKAAVGQTWNGKPIVYVHQDPLDGTGGCVRQVKAQVPDLSERFLILNGDDLYAADDLKALLAYPRALLGIEIVGKKEGTVDAWIVNDQRQVQSLYRPAEGERGWLNPGAYVLDHHWFETDPVLVPKKTDEYGLPQGIPQMVRNGYDVTVIPATFWMPVGSLEELKKAETVLTS